MVGTDRAENVFGQVMICLRMSKLDFLVKETPYSAYVTIRKKFIKSANEDLLENRNVGLVDAPKHNDEKYEKLSEELKSVQTNHAMLQFEYEELELKYEKSEKENIELEDKIEKAFEESRNLQKNVNEIKDDNIDIESKYKEEINRNLILQNKIDNQITTLKKCEKNIKQLTENNMMLENVVESRDMVIIRLKDELKSVEECSSSIDCGNCDKIYENATIHDTHKEVKDGDTTSDFGTTSTVNQYRCKECDFLSESVEYLDLHLLKEHTPSVCDKCDFKAASGKILQTHIVEKHTIKCDFCDETFAGETKLDQHTCRIKVSDPEYFDMYMKNWYIRNACIPVFSRRLKREIILVHSEHCCEN